MFFLFFLGHFLLFSVLSLRYVVLTLSFPGGGDVKIESHKVNVKAQSKIGSLDNIGLEKGNGNGHSKVGTYQQQQSIKSIFKIVEISQSCALTCFDQQRALLQTACSSSILPSQTEAGQEKAEGKTSPPSGTPGSMTKENGVKEAPPFGGEGLRDLGMDKRIPETSQYFYLNMFFIYQINSKDERSRTFL